MGAEGGRRRRLLLASCLIAATIAAWGGSSGALPVDLVPGSSTTTSAGDIPTPSVVGDRPGDKPTTTTTDTIPTTDTTTSTTEGGGPGSTVEGTTTSSNPGSSTTDDTTGTTDASGGSTTTASTGTSGSTDPSSTSTSTATVPGATTVPGVITVPGGSSTTTTGADPPSTTTTTTAPPTEADVSVSIDDGDGEPGDGTVPTVVAPGGTYSYTIVVRNEGPGRSVGAEFVATVPPELLVLGATGPPDLLCSVSGSTSRCTLGAIEAGGSVTLIVAVKVLPATPPGTITALIGLVPGQKDLDPSDNTESESTTIVAADQLADVSVVKDDGDGTGNFRRVPAGGTVAYTLRVGNAGPATATGVVVVDVPPPGATLSDPVAPPGVACAIGDDGALRCVVGTLPRAGVVLIRVTARIGFEVAVGTIVNQAVVSADQPDADHGDNGDAEATVITEPPAADVAIDVSAPALARAGSDVPLDATVTNTGPVPLDAIAIDGPRCVDATVGERTDTTPAPLEPGEQRTYRCELAAPDAPEVDAEVHVVAVDRAGRSVESSDSVKVDLIDPHLTLTALTARVELPGPDVLTLTLRVRNAGDAVVRSIVLTDDIFHLRLDAGTLAPGASLDVEQAVFFANTTSLTVGASGIDPLDGPVSASSTLRIVVGGTTPTTDRSVPTPPSSTTPGGPSSTTTAGPTTTAPIPGTPGSGPETSAPTTAPPATDAPSESSSPVTGTTTGSSAGTTTTAGPGTDGGTTGSGSTAPSTDAVEPSSTSSTRPVLQPGPSIGDDAGEPQAIGPAQSDDDGGGGGVGSAAATVVLGALVGFVLVGLGFTSVNAAIRSRRG